MAKRLSAAAVTAIMCLALAGAVGAAQQAPEQELLNRIAATPGDITARLDLARLYVSQNRLEDAGRMLEGALVLVREQQARAAAPPATRLGGTPVRVGDDVREPAKLRDVPPVYPAVAMAAKIQGFVVAEVLIDTSGVVADVKVLRSHPLFDEAAVTAVRQWRYAPTLVAGEPVPVVMAVTVHFRLVK
jgi:TonB family protein